MDVFDILQSAESKFYMLTNKEGKTWIFPNENLQLSMELYQPSSFNGKLLRFCFPLFRDMLAWTKLFDLEVINVSLKNDLQQLLCRLFCISDLNFSVFCGTPGIHKKITIQLMSKDKILGYCKLTDSSVVHELFLREQKMLDWLCDEAVENIPICIHCGSLTNGIKVFVQSTIKTKKSRVIHEWGEIQKKFLEDLHRRTCEKRMFENTDFYKTILHLNNNIDWLMLPEQKSIVIKAMQVVSDYYKGCEVEFSVCHADFTPWNMFEENGNLFVFDWEYAQKSYPPYLDAFHYITQVAIIEKGIEDEKIIYRMVQENILFAEMKNRDIAYLCYLLHIIHFYFNINNGNFSTEDHSYKCWIKLIKNILANENYS